MTNWLGLKEKEQVELFNQLGTKTGLPPFAIEKDAWVTLVLKMLFHSEIANHIVFKGGTSLSKAYGIIERFSEDIDFAIDRKFLGFKKNLTKGEIRKLRRKSHEFSSNELPQILLKELTEYGIKKDLFTITVPNTKISDQDPEIIQVNYKSIFEKEYYLKSRVLIEIGARSLMEPFENRAIQSIIDINYPDKIFTEKMFYAQTVIPEKTFLEKMILLHEEFQKPKAKIRSHRMSRHLYDIYKIANTEYRDKAFLNNEMFENIIQHREKFTPIKTVNYQELSLKNLNFIPPDDFIDSYRKDYKEMQTNMIYGESLNFESLIEEIKILTKF